MKKIVQSLVFLTISYVAFAQPISLHPENPHYFLYHGKAITIISSSEHYGAVINPAFDYLLYLNALQKDGMNYTRLFTGSYFEKEGSFGIEHNTLAPAPGAALIPWKRSNKPGAICGGNKFDLNQWDENYFARLKSFVSEAAKRGIIVEVTLFSSIYDNWNIQVWNPKNNININHLRKVEVQTLSNMKVLKYQELFVRKIIKELNEFDNVTYEIQNEPWCDHTVTLANEFRQYYTSISTGQEWQEKVEIADQLSLNWQIWISSVIVNEESRLKNKHLIAQNYCNHFIHILKIDPNISILNFHYAYPIAVEQNYRVRKVVGFDESGFEGSEDSTYRKQAWKFILAGGGLFNNLDYSFIVGHEDGSGVNKAPGGGSFGLRTQLKILSDFIHSFDFIKMQPDYSSVIHAPNNFVSVLSEPGKQYAIYLDTRNDRDPKINIPLGSYKVEWINTINGSVVKAEHLKHSGGDITLKSPDYEVDIALKILRL